MPPKKSCRLIVPVIGILIFGFANVARSQGTNTQARPQTQTQPPSTSGSTEAPTGFDGLTNGFVDQAQMDEAREAFEDIETVDDGLGPVFNDVACVVCHGSPIAGGGSQIVELRTGRFDRRRFIEPPGGSLIQDLAIDPAIVEHVDPEYDVRTFRASPSLFGLGYVEALSDRQLKHLASEQSRSSDGRIAGELIKVDLLEAPGQKRPGRFGWKNQHASLLSFASDAYLNEMGITNPLNPIENTSYGNPVDAFDHVPDPEDDGAGLEHFAIFIRSLKAPSRDVVLATTSDALAGDQIFARIGCALCHVTTLVTLPSGTPINGGTFQVPPALGDKVIHPYSDFLLHEVGTGDGIIQNGGPSSKNKIRTAPLWGLRFREHLMHDGESLTRSDAILRHGGEASFVIDRYRRLPDRQKLQLEVFLGSL